MDRTAAPKPDRNRWRRLVSLLVGVAVVVGTFGWVLPRFADYGEVWEEIRSLDGWGIALLAAVTVLNVTTYGLNWMAALPGVTYRQSLEVTMASTAVSNVMPAGGAVSLATAYAMLREWGFTAGAVARTLVLTGIWNQFVNVGFPIVALVLLALQGERNAALESAALIGVMVLGVGVAAFVLVLRSDRMACRIGARWDDVATWVRARVRRGPVTGSPDRFLHFRRESLGILRLRWHWLTVAEIFGALTVFFVLLACLRVTGVSHAEVGLAEAFAAWSLVRLLAAVPITPAGIGVVEIGLVGALVGWGADRPSAVAAVLLYRVLTFVPPLVLGALAWFTWRHHAPVREAAVRARS